MAKSSSSKWQVVVVEPFVPPLGDITSVRQKRRCGESGYGQYIVHVMGLCKTQQ